MIFKKYVRIMGRQYAVVVRVASKSAHEAVFGYTGKVPDYGVVPVLDFDRPYTQEVARNYCSFLSDRYKIGLWFVFQTNKGFHVMSPEIVSVKEYRQMLYDMHGEVDPIFAGISARKGFGILRITEKRGYESKLSYIFRSGIKGKKRLYSLPHAKLLYAWFQIPYVLHKGFVGKKLILAGYRT